MDGAISEPVVERDKDAALLTGKLRDVVVSSAGTDVKHVNRVVPGACQRLGDFARTAFIDEKPKGHSAARMISVSR